LLEKKNQPKIETAAGPSTITPNKNSPLKMSTNQFEQVCGNKCGCVLSENKTIYIMAPPDGEDQAWCEDCTNDLWEELGRKGWTRDGEEYESEEDDDCVIPSCCDGVDGCSQCKSEGEDED
jgi:hypothetical protein